MAGAAHWRVAHGRSLALDAPTLMGVLNVTTDSFSDGGAHNHLDSAIRRAFEMREQGAAIIDIGGESTRPGAERVERDEQVARTIPVIEQLLREGFDGLISIDTTDSAVAERALDAGAHIVNDVSAGGDDPGMIPLAAKAGAGIVLMHRRAAPVHDSFSDAYAQEPEYEGGVVHAVRAFLSARVDESLATGVAHEGIVIDPGLGFGKSVEQNYQLIRAVPALRSLGFAVLSASSRKSFIGAITGQATPSDRVAGTLAISVAQFLAGVRLFRVHDVAAHAHALAVAAALEPAANPRETAPERRKRVE